MKDVLTADDETVVEKITDQFEKYERDIETNCFGDARITEVRFVHRTVQIARVEFEYSKPDSKDQIEGHFDLVGNDRYLCIDDRLFKKYQKKTLLKKCKSNIVKKLSKMTNSK